MPIDQHHEPLLLISKDDQADLTRRALAAWFKAGEAVPQAVAKKPVQARIARKAGKLLDDSTDPRPLWFVVVYAGTVVLAVYRVRQVNDYLMLRRMARPPKDLVRLRRGG